MLCHRSAESDIVTEGAAGRGVVDLIDLLIATDLSGMNLHQRPAMLCNYPSMFLRLGVRGADAP